MSRTVSPSIEALRALVAHDPETGVMRWKSSRGGKAKQGSIVGANHGSGYLKSRVLGCAIANHRLIWALHYGVWPTHDIDHINGNRADNRIANLRDVPTRMNCQNRRTVRKDSKTGLIGVTKVGRRFRAYIYGEDGRMVVLGSFVTPEAAGNAYLSAKPQHHKGAVA